jgi:hypothetical protein
MSTKRMTILSKGLLSGEAGRDDFRARLGSWRPGTVSYEQKGDKIKVERVGTLHRKNSLYYEFYSTNETIKVGMPGRTASDAGALVDLLGEIKQNKTFEDFATEIRVPLTRALNSEKSAKANYEYNYLDPKYEEVLSQPSVRSVHIPSMYGMVKNTVLRPPEDPNFHATLSSPTAKMLRSNLRRSRSRLKYRTQMIVGDPAKTIGTWADSKYLFPMYSEIVIPTGLDRSIARGMQRSNLAVLFMRDIEEAQRDQSLVSRSKSGITTFTETLVGTTKRRNLASDSVDMLDYWDRDLPYWGSSPANAMPSDTILISEPPGADAVVGNYTIQEHLALQRGLFVDTVAFGNGVEILRGKLDLILQKHARNYLQIAKDGDLAHSEILLYKVTKSIGNSKPIQTFYFYNTGTSEEDSQGKIISLIDTQVKYGTMYTYKVTAYVAVVGDRYYYDDVLTDHEGAPDKVYYEDGYYWSEFKVVHKPAIKIFEIPIFSSTGAILAPPPLYPQSYIEQIKGTTHGMLFSFDTHIGESYEEPISFTEAEEFLNNQYLSDEKRSVDGKIQYRTTQAMSGVRVYRIDTPPTDYEDFKDSFLVNISTSKNLSSSLSAGSVASIIKQAPNMKFYYVFRSYGFHGELSNPSPVYEVELFYDGGVSYPIVRLYEFKEANVKMFKKPLKNLLQIRPRLTQAIVNESASGLVAESGASQNAIAKNVILGIEDETLFGNEASAGKRFKIRLTSKDTGRKIDINVTFKTKAVSAPGEADVKWSTYDPKANRRAGVSDAVIAAAGPVSQRVKAQNEGTESFDMSSLSSDLGRGDDDTEVGLGDKLSSGGSVGP